MIEVILVMQTCLSAAMLGVLIGCARILKRIHAMNAYLPAKEEMGPTTPIILGPHELDWFSPRGIVLRDAAEAASLTAREADILEFVYRGPPWCTVTDFGRTSGWVTSAMRFDEHIHSDVFGVGIRGNASTCLGCRKIVQYQRNLYKEDIW